MLGAAVMVTPLQVTSLHLVKPLLLVGVEGWWWQYIFFHYFYGNFNST